MATYRKSDFRRIAAGLGKPVEDIERHAEAFEQAAEWYRIDRGLHEHSSARSPSARRKMMHGVADSARRLLQKLTVDPTAAEDGPTDSETFDLLTFPSGSSESKVLQIIRSIAELERLATEAAVEAAKLGELTVPKGHVGDWAINDWLASMLAIYESITGQEPATSVRVEDGVADGPLIHFVMAAAEAPDVRPVRSKTPRASEEFKRDPDSQTTAESKAPRLNEDAWRSRIRTLRANRRQN